MRQLDTGTTRREFMAAGAATYAAFGFSRTTQADHHEPSAPITQIVKFRMKEGQEDTVIGLLSIFMEITEKEEPGVLVYLGHRSKSDPSEIVLFEVYKDKAAYETHRTAPHWAEISEEFMNAIVLPLDVQMLDKIGGFTR